MKNRLFIVLIVLLAAATSYAGEVAGVTLPDSVTVEGKTLQLNGIGLRTKAIFKVYVAGLYVEKVSRDPGSLVSSDEVKRVEMVLKRGLGKGKIAEAIDEGFEKNSKAQLPALQKRLNQFTAAIPDLKEGDHLVITYVPDKGTTLSDGKRELARIEGKDFAQALFSVWLGPDPVDEALKKAMIGGS